ncbi:hypothetical protein CBR_g54850 [Chara braunii]|uniref:Uncharacterized protein n=1 Tax=Chara braunii TaxID=69332 RepID=A0A388JPN8_CHABU|nr:hypothetical protein CBR_g54850 [Chara braunii]|eukprot:GBG59747.1 hypothetical protein CBR_g54850 [Chara braunii]
MVTTRTGVSTTTYSGEQEERVASLLRERKEKMEKRELIKQAKMLAPLEEQEAKKKQMEEELEKWKDQEEKMAAVEAKVGEEEVEEEEVEEEDALQRRRGEASTNKVTQEEVQKTVNEWASHIELGEERKEELMVPEAEREAARRELEEEREPLRRRAREHEKQLEWKLRLTQERIRRLEATKKLDKELKAQKQEWGRSGKRPR